MTQAPGTHSTYDMVGIREELADVIYDISPIETPFLSMIAQASAENTLFEWQTDSLAAAATTGAVEGDDAPADSSTATTRLNNRTHIRTRDARVSGTGRSVNAAGRADELDYQLLKRGKELKRDMEKILLDNNAKATGSDTVARETAGIESWIVTNIDEAADATVATGDGSDARADGTARAFTEDQLKDVMRQTFDEGGMPDVLMAGAFNRQIISSFSAGRTNVQKAEDSVLHATFDVYESDFGRLKVIPNRFQRTSTVLVLQMDMWQVSFLPGRNMLSFPLAKTGDTDAKQILSEFGLRANQEKASGAIYDLTSS